ncbi:hypothetical protein NA57DRAFT_38830 [Rhizodiscina lignyota]|uniref:MOSC domain-containing protein n=1 Tax=Rhizodiscina lignyota TaxID=1504668 RepID=A0A9P4M627_9PEZI|nr:hypothetical protein NA57DRAFT_38830 [Rhizodiscina lignyota]
MFIGIFINDNWDIPHPLPTACRRVGLTSPKNLEDERDPKYSGKDASKSTVSRVKGLFIYPVKSCMPVELEEGEIVPTGMKYDRQFSFAQLVTSRPEKQADGSEKTEHQWRFITQREVPRLALVKAELYVPDPTNVAYHPNREDVKNAGCIIVSFPFRSEVSFSFKGLKALNEILKAKYLARDWSVEPRIAFNIPFLPTTERMKRKNYPPKENMAIWKENPEAINMSSEIPSDAIEKLKYFLGVSNPLTLFRVDASNYREVFRCAPKEDEVGYQPVVGFADAYPLHILNIASVQDVAERLPAEQAKDFAAIRFRANIYLTGPQAFAEDHWKRIRIGKSEYHVSCRTARCKLPNVDPKSGVPDRNEPYATMAKYRRIDEGAGIYPCLGMQVTPMDGETNLIKVGDEIEVLETGEHFYIKQ